ncbi:MAG: hypothetical protein ACLQM6_05095 [Acidobacteriaceae bacterium]
MRPLSATEAIGPALERTKDVLARPFRLGTFLKIAAVAFFAEMGGGFNLNLGRGGSNGIHQLPPAFIAFIVAFAVILGLVSFVIGLILFYIGSRLQLVLLELVATRYTFVGPLWRKYGSRTWRWIGLKLLFLLCVLIVLLPFVIAAILFFIHHFHGFDSIAGFNPFAGLHLAQILLFIAIAFLVLLVLCALYLLVRDLALPFLALEDLTISQSLERLRALFAAQPGQLILYVILRMVLGIVFTIAAEIAVFLVLLISLIPPGIVGVILWLSLRHAGTAGTILLVASAIFGGLVYLCWAICMVLAFMGSLLTFFQAYALYFLGGRYPLLGDLLDRSTPPPVYAHTDSFPPQPPLPVDPPNP